MKSWNLHSWYITGILVFLLIMSISLQWNRIPDLPGVISFALGLASLLLAIIAIVQALSGSSDVNAGLSSIRSAADYLKQLAGQMTGFSGRVADTSDRLMQALHQAESSNTLVLTKEEHTADNVLLSRLPFGGTVALYAAAWSVITGRSFNMGMFVEESNYIPAAYGDGFLSALVRYGVIEGDLAGGYASITNLKENPEPIKSQIRARSFPSQADEYKGTLDRIDAFFSASTQSEE